MIGQLTQLTLDATNFALAYVHLSWQRTNDSYRNIRNDAQSLLKKMGIEDIVFPDDVDAFHDQAKAIDMKVNEHLSSTRGRILGDTVALPFYWISKMTYQACTLAMLAEDYSPAISIIEDCLEDLGFERKFAEELESELDWVRPSDVNDELRVQQSDVIRTGARFMADVIRNWTQMVEIGSDISKLQPILSNLEGQIRESREESRKNARQLEDLIKSGNKEVLDYLTTVQEKLIDAGISEAKAISYTKDDPKSFWERFNRWQAKEPWRDAVEEAMWEALDFVPGGKGVKLGIRIVRAIRKSFKDKS